MEMHNYTSILPRNMQQLIVCLFCHHRGRHKTMMYTLRFHFLIGINLVMKNVVNKRRRGIRWTLTSLLENLYFADEVAFLSHVHHDRQAKIDDMTSKFG